MNDETLELLLEQVRVDLGFYLNGRPSSKEVSLRDLIFAVRELTDHYVSKYYDGGEP